MTCTHRFGRVLCFALAVMSLSAGSVTAGETKTQSPEGLWDGSIRTSAGDVSFGIELKSQEKRINAVLMNGTDRQPFSSATWGGSVLTLRLDYYDGTLVGHMVSPQQIEGEYSRLTSKGIVNIPLTLILHQEATPGKAWTGPTLAGSWLFTRPTAGEDKITLATFQQETMATSDGKVHATGILEPVSGDTGLLHGRVYNDAGGHTHFP